MVPASSSRRRSSSKSDKRKNLFYYPFAAALCATIICLAVVRTKVASFEYGPEMSDSGIVKVLRGFSALL